MTQPDDRTPDRDLARLVTDAVADVEPQDRLAEIRERTAPRPRRLGWYAAGGASLAAAAAVVAVAVVGGSSAPTADPDPLTGPPPTVASDAPTTSAPQPTGSGETTAYTLYYVGDTARGPRLYSEVRDVAGARDLTAALTALEDSPLDPDYRSLWPAGSFAGAGFDGIGADGQVSVTLSDASLHDRPSGMSELQAQLAVESVIWTLQSALSADGQPVRAPVQFYLGTNPIDQVYGVPTSEPLANGSSSEVLSQMSISSPSEGATVSGSFVAEGANNGFEATMTWQLLDATGSVALDGFATAEGWMEDRLFPWRTDPIDVSGLAPGSYTFVAANDDPSGGTEGSGPDTDTRSITVE